MILLTSLNGYLPMMGLALAMLGLARIAYFGDPV